MTVLPVPALILGCLLCIITPANADTIKVAVAVDFYNVMEILKEQFQSLYGHTLELHHGTSEDLKQLVSNDTKKFDLFLSSDNVKTAQLEQQDKILENSRTVYAQGVLAFWHGQWRPLKPDDIKTFLIDKNPPVIHITNPEGALYRQTTKSVLQKYKLYQTFRDQDKLVYGKHVEEAWTDIKNSLDAGFLPFSQLAETDFDSLVFPVRVTLVPQSLYTPLLKELVILKATEHEVVAGTLVEYLLANETQKFIAFNGGYLRAPAPVQEKGFNGVLSASSSVHGFGQFFLTDIMIIALVKLPTFLY